MYSYSTILIEKSLRPLTCCKFCVDIKTFSGTRLVCCVVLFPRIYWADAIALRTLYVKNGG